jgi:hypothetical protein
VNRCGRKKGFYLKSRNCSRFFVDADLQCGKADFGRNKIGQFILLLLEVLSTTLITFWRLLTFRTFCPLVFKRGAACMTLHEKLVSAGPVVLYVYVLFNNSYNSSRNSNVSLLVDANGELGLCGSLMTSLLTR